MSDDRDRVTAILTLAEKVNPDWRLSATCQDGSVSILRADGWSVAYDVWQDDAAYIVAVCSEAPDLLARLLEALDTIDSQRAEMTKLYDAANEYLGNAGKGAPRGIRADLWDRLAEVVTEHETWQALNGGNE